MCLGPLKWTTHVPTESPGTLSSVEGGLSHAQRLGYCCSIMARPKAQPVPPPTNLNPSELSVKWVHYTHFQNWCDLCTRNAHWWDAISLRKGGWLLSPTVMTVSYCLVWEQRLLERVLCLQHSSSCGLMCVKFLRQ